MRGGVQRGGSGPEPGETAADDVWVGLDLGTQSARAYVVSGDGRVVGSAGVALRSVREGARHEQDPRQWFEAVAAASRAALAGIAPERVRGVATCATSGTIVLVDAAGGPLTPGVMYDDMRAGAQAARIDASGAFEHPISPSWALPKLLWMLESWPQLGPGARLAQQADVVTRALAGHEVPSDCSHALKSGYDQQHETWPWAELETLGVPGALLPEVVRGGSLLGEVCPEAAERTGIPPGTPVIAGMTDGCGAQFAAGAVRAGSWNAVLGTTLVLKGCSELRVDDPSGLLYSHRAPDGGWLPGGASSCGAGVLTAHFPGRDLDDLGRRAAAFEGTSALAYPLVTRGERFPFAAPAAEAFVCGEPAGEAELFAALAQGVAFVERLCFDYLDLLGAATDGELTLTGGASRSRPWCQLRADVLGRPVRLVEQPEAAVGMAILAASASASTSGPASASASRWASGPGSASWRGSAGGGGGAAVASPIARMVRTREVIAPRTDRAPALTASYLRLVDELERRGWLGERLASHARARADA
ncbi:MAG TPA: FGGY family carbohydrate kinase [Solirubrobacteraceae bacterium]|jgi:sugar (pentulose or hexulose) kinase